MKIKKIKVEFLAIEKLLLLFDLKKKKLNL